MKDLYERLRELSEGEARSLLNDLLKLTVPFTEQGNGEQMALADSIVQIYEKACSTHIPCELKLSSAKAWFISYAACRMQGL